MAIILIGVAYAVFCMVKYSKPGYIETETYQTRLGFVVYNEARRRVQMRCWLHMMIPTAALIIAVALGDFLAGIVCFLICVLNWLANSGDFGSLPSIIYAVSLIFTIINLHTICNGNFELITASGWFGLFYSLRRLKQNGWLPEEITSILKQNEALLHAYENLIKQII